MVNDEWPDLVLRLVFGIEKGRWKLSELGIAKVSELQIYLEQLCIMVKQVRSGVMAGNIGTCDTEVWRHGV